MVKTYPTSKIGLASTARTDEGQHIQGADPALRSQFSSAALGMGWQLAVVVLVPIVGGYELDSRFDSLPVLTLVGFVISIAGSILVIKRALAAFNNFMPSTPNAHEVSDKEKQS
ncbi:MAG TPA: AtpZ/AtpI family protein [Candidatus Saccharimonadales bacterium]|jgi:hypothetical protein